MRTPPRRLYCYAMYDDMLTTEQMIQMLEEEDSDEEFLGFD